MLTLGEGVVLTLEGVGDGRVESSTLKGERSASDEDPLG